MLANFSWPWGMAWSIIDILNEIPLENTVFHFASDYQLQIALG